MARGNRTKYSAISIVLSCRTKSTSEDDLKSVSSNSRLRHSSSIGSNTSLDERKAPSPSSEIPVSKSTGSLRKTPSIDDSADLKDENGDNNSSTNFQAMSPVSDNSELLPPETNLANGLATPGVSKSSVSSLLFPPLD